MRIPKYIILLILFCFCTILAEAGLDYFISPVLINGESRIEVTMQIKADAEGNATLVYLNEAWGEENLYDCMVSITVLNEGARIKAVVEQNRIYVNSKPFELLKIKYVLKQDFKGAPEKAQYYRPIINENYFHLFGHRLFVIPETLYNDEEAIEVGIEWDTTTFLVQHNFGTEIKANYFITRDELLESIVVGGDFRRETVEVNGIKLHMLTRGEWMKFDDSELADKLESIIRVQRDFWNDYSDEIYTVTLLPLHSESENFIGGTGLSKGFASYCSNSQISKLDNLLALYYHEIMHHWIGGKIRNASRSAELWFSEGFTEYFAHVLMLSEEEITKTQFNQIKKNVYKEYKKSDYSSLPIDKLELQSLNAESEIEKIPYQRGFLYALHLEKVLASQDRNDLELKDLMLKIFKDAQNQHFSNEYFKKVLGQFCDKEEIVNFEKLILKGDSFNKRILF